MESVCEESAFATYGRKYIELELAIANACECGDLAEVERILDLKDRFGRAIIDINGSWCRGIN